MLFVSFWNLALSNLPAGSFTNSVISAHEAAARIASARSEAQLRCVAADDLAAPYKRKAYENHVKLCSALATLNIGLSVEDFFGSDFCIPLEMASVGLGKCLLVVNCAYTYDFMPEPSASTGQKFRFEVLPDSITFNLLQMSESPDAVIGSEIETAAGSAASASRSRRSTYAAPVRTGELLEASRAFRTQRLSADDMVSIEEAAAIAKTSCETIEAWISKGRAIGLAGARHGPRLPSWQFEPALWGVIGQISSALGVSEGWAILSFLESVHAGLDGRTPRAAIEQGDSMRVIELAGADSL